MIWRIIAVAAILALGVAPPAEAGFWGDLKRSFGTAVDNAQHDGAEAVDAVSKGAGDAADAVVEGTESAADFVTGDSANADSQPVDNTDELATEESKQLSKQSKK
jgi:hypothetical protein